MVDLRSVDSFGATVSPAICPGVMRHGCISDTFSPTMVRNTSVPHQVTAQYLPGNPTVMTPPPQRHFPPAVGVVPSQPTESFPSAFSPFVTRHRGTASNFRGDLGIQRQSHSALSSPRQQCFMPYEGLHASGPMRKPRSGKRRKGVQQLITAFDALRSRLCVYPPDRHLSKIETLRMTISYIKDLETLLKESDSQNGQKEETSNENSPQETSRSEVSRTLTRPDAVSCESTATPPSATSPPETSAPAAKTQSTLSDYELLTKGARVFNERSSSFDAESKRSPAGHSDCSELRRVLSAASIFSAPRTPQPYSQLAVSDVQSCLPVSPNVTATFALSQPSFTINHADNTRLSHGTASDLQPSLLPSPRFLKPTQITALDYFRDIPTSSGSLCPSSCASQGSEGLPSSYSAFNNLPFVPSRFASPSSDASLSDEEVFDIIERLVRNAVQLQPFFVSE